MNATRFTVTLLRQMAVAAACACTLATFATHAAPTAPLADAPASPVKDPHYGDALFHFYQPHYFTALTTLMASQQLGRVARHADEAEVLRGGLLLSYGMHVEAGQLFAQLIDKGAPPSVRDRAWYFLAKIRYQRGLPADALAALARIEASLPAELEDDRQLLQANLLMGSGDYAGAATVLGAMTAKQGESTADYFGFGKRDANAAEKTAARQYARFNLGVSLIKTGDLTGGTALLDELGRAPAAFEEARSLRDRANVALGFAALQANQPEQARTYLERVRLAGPQSNKALLGFGWAAASMKNAKLALVPWTELAGRDASDAAVLEARIALPYAYAELGAQGQSLAGYNSAIGAFERESTGLDESIQSIRSGKLMNALLARNPGEGSGEEMGWFWTMRALPDMPHAAHLAQVLAKNEFQEAFKNFRDLRFMAGNLQQWADNLGVFSDMLDARRKAYTERLPQVLARARETGLPAVSERSAALAKDLADAEQDADGVALADTKQRDLIERLNGLRAAQAQPTPDPEVAAMSERMRRVAGALTWQLAQEFPTKVWEAKKAVAGIDQQLAQAKAHAAALAQAQVDEPARFERFAKRIDELKPRLQALMPRVVALSGEQQQAAQGIAVAELTSQKDRLAVYTTQARFAVAQLVDRAVTSQPQAQANTQANTQAKPQPSTQAQEADRARKP